MDLKQLLTNTYPFVNPPLPYGYDALEPYIDEKTMHLHHDAHLQTYVDNLNHALTDYPKFHQQTLTWLVGHWRELPWEIAETVRNNAGGVYNHIMYFAQMAPAEADRDPQEDLSKKITSRFGSFDNLKEAWKTAALSVFGSGYAWMVLDRNGVLQLITTANQDNPLASGLQPVMGMDVWEHAYYLKHYNKRADYIEDWFQVADFSKAMV